jgi:hypothetical protein
VDRSHRRGVPHKTNLADSADSARNVNDPLTVRLVCTKIPYQSIYGTIKENINKFIQLHPLVAIHQDICRYCDWL